ncbi:MULTISPECIES: ABC transporter ATP-binding protein [Streptomyces]|uniref:ABC transporter ATP-binding protein n=1 Tax=Streptomyces doudnae TaxID=3075536 RepID=A0ABD5EPZ9_9ACTN|nr:MULTISPECIES: ABC transporter ATP-binding protein [unclassified Streptomyces]MDT0436368.1 ABC transporter ATP-binding protein [Streptomyces sp. DSM 41981]MYQ62232.1 ATP-binding cassette domain-containing protein [Streptomyces sp. SID4950]SCD33195.1 NitT/TauT family transport system ATP-binding protein [Streptomyces sp. SolWspMP-5a-2]
MKSATTGTQTPASPAGVGREIILESVSKTYAVKGGKEPVTALTSVDLTIARGEFLSLVGPSGCGKSTMLNIIAGLLPSSTGTVRIGDRAVSEPDPSTGIVFQKATLLRWLTIEDNVLLPCKVGRRVDTAALRRADHLLELAGLADFRHRYPRELSGGMQQRASIVRALVGDPEVLLMDEPFSALDEFTREGLQDELMRLWTDRPKTVVFITHNIAEAVYLSDRVGVMTSRPGTLKEIVDIPLARPRTPRLRTDPAFYELVSRIRGLIGHQEQGAHA